MTATITNLVIADDDEDDVDFFQEAVEMTCPRINLTVVKNGTQLISMLREMRKPDAILLDLNMPEKSGIECLTEIKGDALFSDVPVIIFSTSNSERDIKYCLNNGASYYYVKPKTFKGMMHIASDLCSGNLRNQLQQKY
ncbi:MAG TPA: response regulator [Segetibacter sp.]|jgi:CheY-like chemotaxis protein